LPADKQPINQIAWQVAPEMPLPRRRVIEGGASQTVGMADSVIGWHMPAADRVFSAGRRLGADGPAFLGSSFPVDSAPSLSWQTQVQIPQFRRPLWLSDTVSPPTITQGGVSVVIVGPPFFVAAAFVAVAGAWQADMRES
jgi:hypothetical protein